MVESLSDCVNKKSVEKAQSRSTSANADVEIFIMYSFCIMIVHG